MLASRAALFMPAEQVNSSLTPSDRFVSRKALWQRFKPPRVDTNALTNSVRQKWEEGLQERLTRREAVQQGAEVAVEVAASIYLGSRAWDYVVNDLPREYQLPFPGPNENQRTFRPTKGAPVDNTEDWIGHRTGNTAVMTREAAAIGINPDIDIVKVSALLKEDKYFVSHANIAYEPIFGTVFGSYDRASSTLTVLSKPSSVEERLDEMQSLKIKRASAELKKGNFKGKDVRNIRRMFTQRDISLILLSKSMDDVEMAVDETGDREACFFSPKHERDVESAVKTGFSLLAEYGVVMRHADIILDNDTPVVVSYANNWEQVDNLKRRGIKIRAYLNNVPALQREFPKTA